MEAENGTSRSLFDSRSRRRLGSDDSRRGGPFSQEARVVKRKLTTSFGVFAVLAGMAVAVPAATVSASTGLVRQILSTGTTPYSPSPPPPDPPVQPNELGPTPAGAAGGAGSSHIFGVNRSRSIEHTAPTVPLAPLTSGVGVSSTGPLSVLSSFDGLNHRQSRLANGGRQFSLEPPDQGLCVGNGFQMEIINDVLRVYQANGTPFGGAEDLNTFFRYGPAVLPATPPTPPMFRR